MSNLNDTNDDWLFGDEPVDYTTGQGLNKQNPVDTTPYSPYSGSSYDNNNSYVSPYDSPYNSSYSSSSYDSNSSYVSPYDSPYDSSYDASTSDPYGEYDPSRDRSLDTYGSQASVGNTVNTSAEYTYATPVYGGSTVAGYIGAAVGLLIGFGLWYLIEQFGFISYLSAFAIVFTTYGGFIMFAKGLTKDNAIVLTIAMLIAGYFAHTMGYASYIQNEINEIIRMLGSSEKVSFSKIYNNLYDYVNNSNYDFKTRFYGIFALSFFIIISSSISAYKKYRKD